jgi:hypothetical protein
LKAALVYGTQAALVMVGCSLHDLTALALLPVWVVTAIPRLSYLYNAAMIIGIVQTASLFKD